MFPAFAYAIEPGKLTSGWTMTRFDGAGVAAGPAPPPLPPPPLLLLAGIGTCPFNSWSVTIAMTTRARTASAGPTSPVTGPIPYGSRGTRGRAPFARPVLDGLVTR